MDKRNGLRYAFRIAIGITILVLLLAGGVGAVTEINSCTTISEPGYYVLNESILNSAGSCIIITSSDVIFDGAGYTIDGEHGVYSMGVRVIGGNVTVKNLIVTDWNDGILIDSGSDYNTLINNTANSNGIDIYIHQSYYNTLLKNNIGSIRLIYDASNIFIYNNIINKIEIYASFDVILNITKTRETNIIGGPYLGGNFWAQPDGNGYSQKCIDSEPDGICDLPYVLEHYGGNEVIDYLPLSLDKTPPASVTDLQYISYESTYINWTWTDPADSDFAYVNVWIDGIFKENVTKGIQFYNSTQFTPDTEHTIGTRTVDIGGNINQTWNNNTVRRAPVTVHNINKGTDYITIQSAIDDADPGNEIHVDSGTYYENVNVNKQLILRGMDTGGGKPVVDAGGSSSAIILGVDGITLDGFTATRAGDYPDASIKVASKNNTLINNNANSNHHHGIYLFSSNNTLIGNEASGNMFGIFLDSASDNTLIANNASSNSFIGIYLMNSDNTTLIGNTANWNSRDGIGLSYSDNTTLIGNTANWNKKNGGFSIIFSNHNMLRGNNANSNSRYGIVLASSDNMLIGNNVNSNIEFGISMHSGNTLIGNNVNSNGYGINLMDSNNNLIYNNFFNNTNNVQFYELSINTWNIIKAQKGSNIIGGPYLGGNFWAQPDGNGYSQKCIDNNKDGICDIQYEIDSNNIDYLPLSMNYEGKPPAQKIEIDDSDNTITFQNFDIGDNWNINLRDASTNALAYQFSGTIGEGDTKLRGDDWNVWFSCVSQGDLNHGTLRHIMPGSYIVNADGTNSYGKLISSSPSTITVLASDDKYTCDEPLPPPPVPELSTIVLVSAGLIGMLLVLRKSK